MKKFVKASIFVPANGENARLIGIDFGNNEKPFGEVVEAADSEAIRELEEMIREAIPWVVRYYDSKAPLKNEWNFIRNWLEKANKITKG